MLGIVGEQCVPELEQRQHAFVGDEVEDCAVLTASCDEAAPAQASEMVRDAGKCDVETDASSPTDNSPSEASSCRIRSRVGSASVRKYFETRSLRSGAAGS
jgi:hypothetical protein